MSSNIQCSEFFLLDVVDNKFRKASQQIYTNHQTETFFKLTSDDPQKIKFFGNYRLKFRELQYYAIIPWQFT